MKKSKEKEKTKKEKHLTKDERVCSYIYLYQHTRNKNYKNLLFKQILKEYEKYIFKTITQYNPASFDDAYQDGVEGLLHAVEAFDFSKVANIKPSSYCCSCIRGYILWKVRDNKLIKLPRPLREQMKKDANFDSNLGSPLSLDDTDPENRPLEELLPCDINIENTTLNSICNDTLVKLLNEKLFSNKEPTTELEKKHQIDSVLFCQKYGILGYDKMLLAEISNKYDIPVSTIIVKCKNVLENLQKDKDLKTYYQNQ